MLSSLSCSVAQDKDELTGIWKPITKAQSPHALRIPPSIRSIEIRRASEKEISYLVFIDDEEPVSLKRKGNDLIHLFEKDTFIIHYDPSRKT
jgi:hypothetical protein